MEIFFKKIVRYLTDYTDQIYAIGLCIGLFSLTWLKWSDNVRPIIYSLEIYRYILAALFLGLRLLSLFFIDRKYALKSYAILLAFTVSALLCKSVYLIQCAVIIVGMYRLDINKYIKIVAIFSILTYIIDIIGITIGEIENFSIVLENNRFRWYLGFMHPSYFSIHACTLIFSIWYLYLKNNKILSYSAFLLLSLFLWLVPNTRTSSIALAIMPFICEFSERFVSIKKERVRKSISLLPMFIFMVSVAGTFVITRADPSSPLYTFSIRFSDAYNVIHENGVALFATSQIWLDNTYMFLLSDFGIVITMIYILFYIDVVKKCIDKNDAYMLSISIFFMIYGMMDNYGLNPRYNISLLYLFGEALNERA